MRGVSRLLEAVERVQAALQWVCSERTRRSARTSLQESRNS